MSGPATLDPVTLEVLWNRLIAVVEEQARTLMRTAMSGILSDAGDLSAGVFDRGANMVAQAVTGTPGHINTMARGARRFVEEYPLDTLVPGDVLIGNHPYEISGHLNDITLLTPVFHAGRVVGALANCCHMADIGGRGLGVEAHDAYEEGLHIPYTKLYRAGTANEELLKLIRANVRIPELFFGDLHAMVVANDAGARRLGELLEEFGLGDLEAVSEAILGRTERAMRAAIRELPDGTYANAMTVDGYDEPLRIACELRVRGDEIEADFAGSSPQVRWGINVPLGYVTAYTTYALKTVMAPDIPNNEGSFRPLRVTAPEGSLFNPRYPAPVSARSLNGHLAATCVIGALAGPLPERVLAEGATALFNLAFRGQMRGGGLFNVNFMNAGGMGARARRDGLSATAFPSGIRGTPVEVIETTAPLLVRCKELRPDSAGAGRTRGGLGQVLRIAVETEAPYHFPARYSRAQFPPRGVRGGGPAAPLVIRTGGGRALAAMGHHVLPPGEEIVLELPGGGGYGHPHERDPALVLRDVIGGYVSAESARRNYGVVVDAERGVVDEEATRRSREAHAAPDPAAFVAGVADQARVLRTSSGGAAMVWREWGAGRPLVLLHGSSGSWRHWVLNVLPLARHFRVLVPDLPGFGDSDDSPAPTADALAGAVAAGLDHLVPTPTAVDLAGFSFGGIIAGLVAARPGARVRTLVLLGPNGMAIPMGETRPLIRPKVTMTPEEVRETHRENLRILMIADPARADDLAVHVHAENLARARFKSGGIPASDALLRALPGVRARIAGIWGGRDAMTGPYLAERREVLSRYQPDLDFRVIEGAGHWTPYEAAAAVNAALVDILGAA